MINHIVTSMLGSFILLLGSAALAAQAGDALPLLQFEDQAGKEHVLDANLQRIYTTGDRAGDKLMKKAMKAREQALLDAQHAVVVADISDAPGFVKRIIRSSLKKRSYTTLLDLSGSSRGKLSYRPDSVTVMSIVDGRIAEIRHVSDLEELIGELTAAVRIPEQMSPRYSVDGRPRAATMRNHHEAG